MASPILRSRPDPSIMFPTHLIHTVRSHMRRLGLVLCLAILLVWTAQPVLPLSAGARSRYFAETGHNVQGFFLDFYEAHGDLDVFGHPLTEQFRNDQQLLVQFFQRAVMEYRPWNKPAYQVQLALLGDLLGHGLPRVPEPKIKVSAVKSSRYYPQTGHSVEQPFLTYFDAHGGVYIFGYPVAEPFVEDGRLVQYFQRTRMEYYPDNPSRYRIQLGLLGTAYANAIGLDPAATRSVQPLSAAKTPTPAPRAPQNTPQPVVRSAPTATPSPTPAPVPLCAASVGNRVTGIRGTQTINARVSDKTTGRGLPDVAVMLTVHFPEGNQTFNGRTNADGAAVIAFDLGVLQPGVIIVVEAGFESDSQSVCDPVNTYFMAWNSS